MHSAMPAHGAMVPGAHSLHCVLLEVEACVPARQGEQTPAALLGSCRWPAGQAQLEAVAVTLGDAVTAAEADADSVTLLE